MRRATRLTDLHGAEWLYEAGIGEDRAILTCEGGIIEARIERHDGIKSGLVTQAKLIKQLARGKRGIIELPGGEEALLTPLSAGITEGQTLTVEITREAIDEKSRFKLPLAKVADSEARPAVTLLQRIEATRHPVRHCQAHQEDHFAAVGWHELIEEARSGKVDFAGGSLLIGLTPAMALIDVDGDLPPLQLSLAAAGAAARAIRRLDLQGSIGIDFPDVGGKRQRQQVVAAFDAAMAGDHERTAINGFGFMQIITRRQRPSLPELLQRRRMTGHGLELLRLAERDRQTGDMQLTAHPAVLAKLEQHTDWLDELGRRTGRRAALQRDPGLAIGGGYVAKT